MPLRTFYGPAKLLPILQPMRWFRRGRIKWFKKVLVVSNIKLQTDRMSTVLMLQGRDQDRKLRIDLLYTAMGGVGGV